MKQLKVNNLHNKFSFEDAKITATNYNNYTKFSSIYRALSAATNMNSTAFSLLQFAPKELKLAYKASELSMEVLHKIMSQIYIFIEVKTTTFLENHNTEISLTEMGFFSYRQTIDKDIHLNKLIHDLTCFQALILRFIYSTQYTERVIDREVMLNIVKKHNLEINNISQYKGGFDFKKLYSLPFDNLDNLLIVHLPSENRYDSQFTILLEPIQGPNYPTYYRILSDWHVLYN